MRFPIYANKYMKKLPKRGSARYSFARAGFATYPQCFPKRIRKLLQAKKYRKLFGRAE